MPVVNHIDGAYFYPQTLIYGGAWQSVQVVRQYQGKAGGGATLREQRPRTARSVVGIRGESVNPAALSSVLGLPQRGLSVMALNMGTSQAIGTGVATGAMFVQGETARPGRFALSVGQAIIQRAGQSRAAVNLQSSRAYRNAAQASVIVRGERMSRAMLAQTVQGQTSDMARAALGVKRDAVYSALGQTTIARTAESASRQSAEVWAGEGLIVLADLISPALQSYLTPGPDGFYLAEDIEGQLTVNGVAVPIQSFDLQEPPGRLGALLNITLAIPDRNQVPMGADIRFDLIVYGPGGTYATYPVIKEGKIAGRSLDIRWADGPSDTVQMGSLDTLNDKFSLRPKEVPITMFDPEKVQYADVAVKVRDAIVNEKGQPILPSLEPVERLTSAQAIDRAYTGAGGRVFMSKLTPAQSVGLVKMASRIGVNEQVGCGFAGVITNIPAYPIERVDFMLEASWHDAVQPLVGMYGPIYFVEFNTLFILDAETALPAGHIARVLPLDYYMSMTLDEENREPYNAVILTHQVRPGEDDLGSGLSYRELYDTPAPVEEGTYGKLDYRRIEVTRRYFEYLDEEGQVVDTGDLSILTRTFGHFMAGDGGPGALMELHRELHQNFYRMGLNTGHHKDVYALITTGPDASLELQLALTEDCEIAWQDNPFVPGQKIQQRSHTSVEGLFYYDDANTVSRMGVGGDREEVPLRVPMLVAQARSGIVQDDGYMGFGPVKTVTETLRSPSPTQLEVSVVEIDCLTGTVLRSTTQPRTGTSAALAANEYRTRQRSMLLRNLDSEEEIGPRVPVNVSAGELPLKRAIELGRRVLAQGFDPPETCRMDLPGVDFALRRGSVIKGQFRDGSLTNSFLVRGYSIRGENLGRAGHRISTSLDAVELG